MALEVSNKIRHARSSDLQAPLRPAADLVGGLLLSPLLLLLALAVWRAHGRPLLFRQARPGYRGQHLPHLQISHDDRRA